jgi:hypothetical protein
MPWRQRRLLRLAAAFAEERARTLRPRTRLLGTTGDRGVAPFCAAASPWQSEQLRIGSRGARTGRPHCHANDSTSDPELRRFLS